MFAIFQILDCSYNLSAESEGGVSEGRERLLMLVINSPILKTNKFLLQ